MVRQTLILDQATPRLRLFFFLLAIACTACASPTATLQPSSQSAKIYIADAGLYRLTRSDLLEAGFGLPSSDSQTLARLHLVHRDEEIPIEIEGQGDNWAIRFYADPDYSQYSATDVYWLRLEASAGLRIPTRTVKPKTEQVPAQVLPTMVNLEEDSLYSSKGIGGSHWFWASLTSPATKSITATLTALRPGNGAIDVAIAGETTGEHKVRVSVNDRLTGTATWKGQSIYKYNAQLADLNNGPVVVTLELPNAGDTVDVVLLDSVTLHYSSEFSATNDSMEFGGAQDFQVKGFQEADISLYDISNTGRVQKLDGFDQTGGSGDSSLTFHDDLIGRRYLAIASAAIKKPVRIRTAGLNNLLDAHQQADYLAIAPAGFADALQPLLKYRSSHGINAHFIDVDQVYDAFSGGVPDPRAIRAFVQYARQHWAKPSPGFVLLAGKASYDYRDNLNAPNKNLVPTFLVPTPDLGEAASDDWFVPSGESDPHPALAIGRIPAKTPEELTTVIDKIISYESVPQTTEWRGRAVFVSDKEDPAFDASSDQLASQLPKDIQIEKIYLAAKNGDLDSTRSEIIKQWNSGALLMTYIGHGSIDTWAAGPLFSAENVAAIDNGDRLPVLLTPTCLDGFFYHPNKDSLAEDLLFKRGGGIVGGLVPTGLSVPQAQDLLMNSLFTELFVNRNSTLGEAIRRAKQKLDANSPDTREVLDTFQLLGDPALKWAPPQ